MKTAKIFENGRSQAVRLPKTLNTNDLKEKVYTLRNVQVMLDFDLAEIYGYEVKRLNEQVKRNAARFPGDFMFQLNREELETLRSQFVTSSELVKSQFATSRKNNFFKGKMEATENSPMHLLNKVYTCLLQYLKETLLRGKVFL